MSAVRIVAVEPSVPAIAGQLHAVQMRAYAQEAALLGAIRFPPLERTVEDLRTTPETFLAALHDGVIVAAISMEPDAQDGGINIASLVVDPHFQRRGIGRQLLQAVLSAHGDGALTVQTGARNLPALALYEAMGFVPFRRWLVGAEPLELVKLRRGRVGP